MDGEGRPADANIKQALYWRKVYTEILAMEEKVLDRIHELMAKESPTSRREVELTNVPVVVAQAERFRQRLGYWEARVTELDGHPGLAKLDGHSGLAELDGHPRPAELDGHPGPAELDGHPGLAELDGHSGLADLDGHPGAKPHKPQHGSELKSH
jgi:hypothetical protein